MTTMRGEKLRVYPTKEQEEAMFFNLGCVRKVYNMALDYIKYYYEQGGKYPGLYGPEGLQHFVVALKQTKNYAYLKNADKWAIELAQLRENGLYRCVGKWK